MPVHLTAVKCPSCGQPIQGKAADRVFLCTCGVLHTRDDDGTRQLEYAIAPPKPASAPPSAVLYVPFWRLDADVAIHYSRSTGMGGFFNKLFGKDWKGGRVSIYVPAVDWDPGTYKRWASTVTSSPPKFKMAQDFGPFEKMPVVIDETEAKQLADFLILTFEAEKSGVLQEMSYEVKVFGTSLLYLPFNRGEGSFTPML
jgi:hypothetical protein